MPRQVARWHGRHQHFNHSNHYHWNRYIPFHFQLYTDNILIFVKFGRRSVTTHADRRTKSTLKTLTIQRTIKFYCYETSKVSLACTVRWLVFCENQTTYQFFVWLKHTLSLALHIWVILVHSYNCIWEKIRRYLCRGSHCR